jgi:ubiquinone biosynthesis protein UbiJ
MPSLLSFINESVNKVLAYDLVAQKKLSQMNGRSLCWDVSGWGMTLVFQVDEGKLIINDRMIPCQVTVTASPQELFDLWQKYEQDTTVNLKITGNPLALQDFAQLFKALNIDWEALLEEFFGAFNANLAGRVVGKVGSQMSRTLHRIRDDIKAYHRDEVNN